MHSAIRRARPRAAPPCACSTRCCARACRSNAALDAAARDLDRADDRAFAHAIAAEALRRLPDLDELIDHATQKRLPDDAKARFALRIALVQALAMETPHHAAISTVLPLVDGGPRKLVHGVFSAVMRQKCGACPMCRTCPPRWRSAGARPGARRSVAAAARLIAVPPPIDLLRRAARRAGGRQPDARPSPPRRAAPPSPASPAMARAAGGCRTSPPRSRRACSGRARAAPCSTFAPRPAARRCSSPPPAGR